MERLIEAREQYLRLDKALSVTPLALKKMTLPPVSGHITCRNAVVIPPGQATAIANII